MYPTPAYSTSSATSSGPGSGAGASAYFRPAGPSKLVICMAFIVAFWGAASGASLWRAASRGPSLCAAVAAFRASAPWSGVRLVF